MKQVKILEFSDGNLTGFVWSWEFVLTKRKDGTFSLRGRQTTMDTPAMKIPLSHPIRNGGELFTTLEEMLSEAGYSVPDDAVLRITEKIARLSKPFARDFAEFRGHVY